MFNNFKETLDRHGLLGNDRKILLGVSGGVDSVVLLHLMQAIPTNDRPQLSVAHINHQLREEADMEEAFVKQLARDYQLPFYSKRWEKEEHPKTGIEEAARSFRYSFFRQLMEEGEFNILMTAHHQDDQVETILMKLTRGSSLEQLVGIQFSQPFSTGYLVRPLLDVSKNELYTFAKQEQLTFVEDVSNKDLSFTRNRFRHSIIPLLKKENPLFNQQIIQFSKDLDDLLEISKDSIQLDYKKAVSQLEGKWYLEREIFMNYSQALQRTILKEILHDIYLQEEVMYKTNYISILQDWIQTGDVNTSLDLLNDFIVEKEYNRVIFSKKEDVNSSKTDPIVIKETNQWIPLSDNEKIGLFEVEDVNAIKRISSKEDALVIDENELNFPLIVRHREDGDRMRYAGLNGTKKIKDIFIDEKVPLKERDHAWVVEDATGKILWLVTYRKMNLSRTQETDKLTYILKYYKEQD